MSKYSGNTSRRPMRLAATAASTSDCRRFESPPKERSTMSSLRVPPDSIVLSRASSSSARCWLPLRARTSAALPSLQRPAWPFLHSSPHTIITTHTSRILMWHWRTKLPLFSILLDILVHCPLLVPPLEFLFFPLLNRRGNDKGPCDREEDDVNVFLYVSCEGVGRGGGQ